MIGQRRIDRILDDSYLDGLADRSTAEIRRMRDECEEEESGLSYARRVVQGRLDILRAEAERRRDAGQEAAASILEGLPDILGDRGHTSSPAQARPTRFLVPPHVKYHRRDVDQIADDDSLAGIRDWPVEQLAALVEKLTAKETEFSRLRRIVLDRIDRLQAELISRYKDGTANVTDVLAEQG